MRSTTTIIERVLQFDVMPETYRQTTLGLLRDGRRVTTWSGGVCAADRLSGHVLRGVVEGIGRVCERHSDGDATVIIYSAPEYILTCIIERGPISVDGISLTVVAKSERTFSVSIVKLTGENTNILERAVGDPVSLESDIMMRDVALAVENRRRLTSSDTAATTNALDPLLTTSTSLIDLVEAVRALPYGRPSDRSVDGLLRESRGTCSTKHLFLAQALRDRFPHTEPQIMHRVYRAEREKIRERFGDEVSAVVPEDGLVDVHRYLLIRVGGRQIALDVTFTGGERWDGRSSLPLACGPGEDFAAGDNPDSDKRELEASYCNPAVREPFIAALSATPEARRLSGLRIRK